MIKMTGRVDVTSEAVEIKLGSVVLEGNLERPNPRNGKDGGLVVFAHGSGSSRFSPRNSHVAKALQEKGFGTLLFDLLTEQEDQKYETRFDIELLSERLEKATSWVLGKPQLKSAHVGYFGLVLEPLRH